MRPWREHSPCTREIEAAVDSTRGSAVTVTTSTKVVGSSIWRLSHHRMMSGNVCDGLDLVHRPYNIVKWASDRVLSAGLLRGVNSLFTAGSERSERSVSSKVTSNILPVHT